METADFMADFVQWDEAGSRYVLPPPLIPAQEIHKSGASLNPTFELEYWHYGLKIAARWRRRLGLKDNERWNRVARHLAGSPRADGVYLAHENCPNTCDRSNVDHPSMLAAMGMLPGWRIDRDVMKNTLHQVLRTWQFETLWGWDFPMMAMCAARLGEPELAVEILMMDEQKNTYLANGHNFQDDALMVYLPGNGGLLAAVAMMAAGWEDAPRESKAPGFPQNGLWTVHHERVHGLS
jgi:hypothetical protein